MKPPACEQCRKPTRLVGLERHEDDADIEVLTFVCDGCGHYTPVEAKTGVYLGPIIGE